MAGVAACGGQTTRPASQDNRVANRSGGVDKKTLPTIARPSGDRRAAVARNAKAFISGVLRDEVDDVRQFLGGAPGFGLPTAGERENARSMALERLQTMGPSYAAVVGSTRSSHYRWSPPSYVASQTPNRTQSDG